MTKPFAAFDVDGTIFKSSLAEKVVDACIDQNVFNAEKFNDVYANRKRWQINNNEGLYQAYLHRLVATFVDNMAGVDVEQFDHVTQRLLSEHQVRKFAFPRMLIKALQPSHHIVAISGSPDILVKPFLRDLGVHETFGSVFEQEDGKFTGAARGVGDKADILKDLVENNVATRLGSVALGDTVSDEPMLHYAEIPIMFNASSNLTNYGKEFGWLRVNEVKDQITALKPTQVDASSLGAYQEYDINELIYEMRQLT